MTEPRIGPSMGSLYCAGIPRGGKPRGCGRQIAEIRRMLGSDGYRLALTLVTPRVEPWPGLTKPSKPFGCSRLQALVPRDFSGVTDILTCPKAGPFDAETARLYPNAPEQAKHLPNWHNAWYTTRDDGAVIRNIGGSFYEFERLRSWYEAQEVGKRGEPERWSPAVTSTVDVTRELEERFNMVLPLVGNHNRAR